MVQVTRELQQSPPSGSDGSPPTTEIGSVTQWAPGLAGWSTYIGDDLERAPELQWPQSVLTYSKMRNDAQVQGLYLGTTLPLRRYRWMIDPNECDPAMAEKLAADLNLPIKGAENPVQRLRSKGRFSFHKHQQDALLALIYGHYGFEEVGMIREDDGLWHLTKISPRPPETINAINLTDSGDLQGITQYYALNSLTTPIPIPADRLLWYAWQREGGNWPGRSMLRACYRNWLRKDKLLRVDANKHERNGLGVPIAEAPPNLSGTGLRQLDTMMRRVRAGDMAGGAVPHGTTVKFVGTTGSLPDTVASMRFDNEEMARGWLAMFMQLGQTETGSRALGSEFIDFFSEAVDTMAQWFADTFNLGMIENWWDWNVDEDADATPLLCYARNPDSAFVGRDIAMMVRYGALTVDETLENAIRERVGLPDREASDNPPAMPAASGATPWPQPEGYMPPDNSTSNDNGNGNEPTPSSTNARNGTSKRKRSVRAAITDSPVSLPARPLRRQLYTQEIRAAVDWASMDAHWALQRQQLVLAVKAAQRRQIDELHDQIVEAGNNLDELAAIQATPNMKEIIDEAMGNMAIQGARDVQAEASRQGVGIQLPNLSDLSGRQSTRAQIMDTFLARTLSNAAQNTALRLAGGNLSGTQIAEKVHEKLSDLSDSYLSDQLGGALSVAQNNGRSAAMRDDNQKNIYASEILDNNTCSPCIGEDGTQFQSIDEAEADYPAGGFMDCEGGARCRGTLIAVYGENVDTIEGG